MTAPLYTVVLLIVFSCTLVIPIPAVGVLVRVTEQPEVGTASTWT